MQAFNYGQLLALAIGDREAPDAEYIEDASFHRTHAGAQFRLPTGPFLELAVIGADDVAGDGIRGVTSQPDFPVERATAILDRLTTFEVAETRGRVPVGTLPAVTMQAESMTAGTDSDPGVADHEYHCASVVEAKSSYSTQLVLTAGRKVDVSAFVEQSHRQAVRQKLLEQVVSGVRNMSNANSLSGILSASGIGSGTYAQVDRGKESAFTTGESAVEDADGDPAAMAWLLGRDIHDSAKGALLEPGSDRRTLERGRMSVSGYPVYRSDSALAHSTGLLCDWASVVLVIQSGLGVTVDRISRPGEVRITSRLAVADPIVTRAARVYALTQA